MAITRYAGDRFTIANSDTKPTNVMEGAFLIDTGNLTSWILRGATWTQLAGGGGGGGTPGGSNTQVQFNNNGSFGGDADLTFTNGNRLNVNKLGISGNIYDSNNSVGNNGMVLTNQGETGVQWKNIESVLSGVGGSGVANYVARWSDEDTLTSGIIQDNGTAVGINQAADPNNTLAIKSIEDNANPLQIAAHDGDSLFVFRQTAGDGRLSIKKDGGVETIRLDSDNVSYITGGSLGIGTNAPYYKLDLRFDNSDTSFSGGGGGNWGGNGLRVENDNTTVGSMALVQFRVATADWFIGNKFIQSSPDQSDFIFSHEDSEKVRIKSDGNVGIGTTAPGSIFHVYSSASAMVKLQSATGNNDIGIDFFRGSDRKWQIRNNGNNDSLFIIPQGVNDADATFAIKSDGNVGIGTNSPSHRLNVLGATTGGWNGLNLNVVISSSNTYANGHAGGIAFGGAYNSSETQTVLAGVWASRPNAGDGQYAGMVHIGAREHGTSNIEKVINVSYASVGIGTATPAVPLHITKSAVGDNEIPEVIRLSTLNSASPNWSTTDGLCIGAEMKKANGTTITKQPIRFRYDGGNMATTFEAGNVGIGTDQPLNLLMINGSSPIIRFRDSNAAGTPLAYIDASDGALKLQADASDETASSFLTLEVDGSEHVRVIDDGNVGIGTTAPAKLLTVRSATSPIIGLYSAYADSNARNWAISTNNAAYGDFTISNSAANGGNPNAIKLSILKDGNVGIGVTDPDAKLEIKGTAGSTGLTFKTTDSSSNNTFWIQDGGKAGLHYYPFVINQDNSDSDCPAATFFYVHHATAPFTIKNNGNVGIGTTAPLSKFNVLGTQGNWRVDPDSVSNEIQVLSSNTANTGFRTFRLRTNETIFDTGGSERMRILSDGKVGIGTTNPQYLLEVYGDATLNSSGATTDVTLRWEAAGATKWRIKNDTQVTSGTDHTLTFTSAGDANISINQAGNVGIGTNNPDYTLTVNAGTTNEIARFKSTDNDALISISDDTDTVYVGLDASADIMSLGFSNSFASTNLSIDTGGNVGINNASPEHKLHVAGDAIISGYLYDSTNSTGVDGYVLTSKEDGPQWKMIEDVLSGVGGNGTANYIPKWIDSDTIGDSVIAESGGNIGIGTTTPEQLFEISATGDAAIQFQSTKTSLANDDPIGSIIFKNNDSSGTDPHICGKIASIAETVYGRAGLAFSTGRTSEFDERMRIRYDGNIGINTTAPGSILQIKGDSTLFGSTITVRESTGTTDRFYGGLDANEHGYISLLGSDNTNRVYLSGVVLSVVIFLTMLV